MTQAKQILMKHLSSGHEEIEVSFHPTDIELIIAAMQEYAALTSPASGWVKCKNRMPTELLRSYYCKIERSNGWKFKDSVLITLDGKWVTNDVVEWLEETLLTPLPTVEECMEYAKKEGRRFDGGPSKYFSFNHNQFVELLKYAQKPVK